VADQLLKASRAHNLVRVSRDTRVRDAVRERDASRINEAVLAIISEAAEKMNHQRTVDDQNSRVINDHVEVVDWGIRTFGSYVGETISLKFSINLP
jgi:exportin-T